MKKTILAVAFLFYGFFACISVADNFTDAIQEYTNYVRGNKETMSWFIPFRSFAEQRITDRLYGCGNGCNDGECCMKSIFSPIFYVVLPTLHLSAEIIATPTLRLGGSFYFFYLLHKNNEALSVIGLLTEMEKYNYFKKTSDKEGKRAFYMNTTYLKTAFKEYKERRNSKDEMRVSNFIEHVQRHVTSDQYKFLGKFWSINDFIDAADRAESADSISVSIDD